MNKKRTLQRIKVSYKNLKEIEICTKNNFKDLKLTIKKFTKKLLTKKKHWNKKKINFLGKKSKSKNLTNKLLPLKKKEMPILFKQPPPKLSIFMPEIKSNSEIILLHNFKSKTSKQNQNLRNNNLCTKLSEQTGTLFLRNSQKYNNKNHNTVTDTEG